MKELRFSLATLFFYCWLGQSCSQQTGHDDRSLKKTFEATTPCNDAVKEMLGIPADFKCEMMKWRLTLSNDSKKNPSTFDLVYTYGLGKQGTRGFSEGAKTVELKGKWTIEKGHSKEPDAIITLIGDNSPVTLSFLQPGQNLLHLLHRNKQLVNGTAAWSYTFNRTDPVTVSTGKFTPRLVSSMQLPGISDTVGIYYGRTPCNIALREINNISAEGCQIIKCRLVLLENTNTHAPANFIIQTIYVGNGDNNKYTVTGTWKLLEGTIDNPAAVVYQLLPDTGKSQNQLLLVKADDNILYFIDNDTRLLVGNSYSSYTLNRGM
jgi:hypothetical protein